MQLAVSSASLRGRGRPTNDDAVVADLEAGIFIVCDGVPAPRADLHAAQVAADIVARHVRDNAGRCRTGAGQEVLREAFEAANARLYDAFEKERHRFATTCTALFWDGCDGIVAHVGNTRAYLLRDGKLDRLTEDHDYRHEAVRNGILSPRRAQRSPLARRVTRALGMRDTVTVDVLRIPLLDGDRVLLCTDGVHSAAPMDPRRALVGGERNPAELLVRLAQEADGRDDASAIVIAVHATAPEHRKRTTRIGAALDALDHVQMFEDLTLRERYAVLDIFRTVEVTPGTEVVRQGAPGNSLYVVVEGMLDVRRGGRQVATLRAGSHFGEMALLSNRPRSATVTARAPTRLLELPRAAFLDLIARDATVGAKFLWRLAQMLSLRLDDVYLLLRDTDRTTAALNGLSPFREDT